MAADPVGVVGVGGKMGGSLTGGLLAWADRVGDGAAEAGGAPIPQGIRPRCGTEGGSGVAEVGGGAGVAGVYREIVSSKVTCREMMTRREVGSKHRYPLCSRG